jgi:peptidoglycan pentaglycine glycine transferase (the first glycine)
MSENVYTKVFDDKEKEIWNEFVNNSPFTTVLQLWQWGELKKEEGWKPIRIGVYENNKLLIVAQGLQKRVNFFGNYLYFPHGPVFYSAEDFAKGIEEFLFYLKTYSKIHNCFTIEFEPLIGRNKSDNDLPNNISHIHNLEVEKIFHDQNLVFTKRNIQPKYKLFYDLEETEDILLGRMKKNTRYNVKLAEKKDVKINKYAFNSNKIDQKLEIFYDLLLQMQTRNDGYPIRPKASFVRLIEEFKQTKYMQIIEAKFKRKSLALNISQYTNFWASSFYAASSRELSNLKAPYLLRWQSVLEAKSRGCKIYDFWGFIPDDPSHKGYSDMKLSFGGIRIDMHGIIAMPINKYKFFVWDKLLPYRAKIYKFINKLRNK